MTDIFQVSHLSVQSWRFPSLGVGVIGTDRVDFHVSSVSWRELFVDKRTLSPDARLGGIHAAPAADLAEKSLAASKFLFLVQ